WRPPGRERCAHRTGSGAGAGRVAAARDRRATGPPGARGAAAAVRGAGRAAADAPPDDAPLRPDPPARPQTTVGSRRPGPPAVGLAGRGGRTAGTGVADTGLPGDARSDRPGGGAGDRAAPRRRPGP